MKTVLVAGVAGLVLAVTPAISNGQDVTLASRVPSAKSGHQVRYSYKYTKLAAGTGAKISELSGSVDVTGDDNTLYYHEYRDGQEYREVLYNRKNHNTFLFNHQQNKLNLFNDMPHDAIQFMPFPFDDEEIMRVVPMASVRKQSFPLSKKEAAFSGTLGDTHNPVPVRFLVTSAPTGSQISKFSIQAPDGSVADWEFTYASKSSTLPTTITRMVAQPIMTEAEKQRFMRHETIPPIHWRRDAEISYTLIEDRPLGAGDVPSEGSLVRGTNEKTIIVDRRDLNNPISFCYRKDGGDLEGQIHAARLQGPATRAVSVADSFWSLGKYFLLAPLALCVGGGIWGVRRRMAASVEARTS